MASSRRRLGDAGEAMARRYLLEHGYTILATNYRTPHGEIDIVAADHDGLAFVEVRTRRSRSYGPPEESLTPAKRRHMAASAQCYLQEHPADLPWRLDLVAIQVSPSGAPGRIALVRNAVTGEDLA